MKVYLDDVRPCPPGWIYAQTAMAAIFLLKTQKVEEISLDHDLGEHVNGSGSDVACWIERQVATRPDYVPPKISIHWCGRCHGSI